MKITTTRSLSIPQICQLVDLTPTSIRMLVACCTVSCTMDDNYGYGQSLMAKWLQQASQLYEMNCHDLEVTNLNLVSLTLECEVLLCLLLLVAFETKTYI